MNATTAIMKTSRTIIAITAGVPVLDLVGSPIAGTRPTTMPAKMISEMPLPMPRSLICSPSHMTTAQPVVSVSTVISGSPSRG
jgi:hypothetical protein